MRFEELAQLAGAFGAGGILVAIVNRLLTGRDTLRAEVEQLWAELRLLRGEVDAWREKYLELMREHIELKQAHAALREAHDLMRRQYFAVMAQVRVLRERLGLPADEGLPEAVLARAVAEDGGKEDEH